MKLILKGEKLILQGHDTDHQHLPRYNNHVIRDETGFLTVIPVRHTSMAVVVRDWWHYDSPIRKITELGVFWASEMKFRKTLLVMPRVGRNLVDFEDSIYVIDLDD